MKQLSHKKSLNFFLKQSNRPKYSVHLGHWRLIDSPDFCKDFLSYIAKQAKTFPCFDEFKTMASYRREKPRKPDREFLDYSCDRYKQGTIRSDLSRAVIYQYHLKEYNKKLQAHLQKEDKAYTIKESYSVDSKGYCNYILDNFWGDQKKFFFDLQPIQLTEKKRKKHTYINGSTESGKSELMKTLIYNYLTINPATAVILIDPHGKIAKEVARFQENKDSDRLVYINPAGNDTHSPVFNLFEFQPSSKKDLAKEINCLTDQLLYAFREILGQEGDFSTQMKTILKYCIHSLLLMPNAHIWHLQQFMDDEEGKPLVAWSIRNAIDPTDVYFFKKDFYSKHYKQSKRSIRVRLQSIFGSPVLSRFLLGEKSSFSIEELIDQRKLIIFNLSRGALGYNTSEVLGRLLLAYIQNIAMKRGELTNEELKATIPVHCFIDEFQHFVTESVEDVLTESRKYKFYLTLAHQFLNQIENTKIKNAITGNTGIKITGHQTELTTLNTIQKLTEVNPKEIKDLAIGCYHTKVDKVPTSFIIQNFQNLLDNTNGIDRQGWETEQKRQAEKYYLPLKSFKERSKILESSPLGDNKEDDNKERARTYSRLN